MNFSFAGCGFLGIYHVGVAACLKKYAPDLLVNKISGASAGALAAVCLLCDAPLGVITSSVLKTATEARQNLLGPFSPTFNVEKLLREGLLSVLPDDAHEIVNGKLFISVTRVCDGKNVLLSQFETREELIQALLCSAFIPAFSGWSALTIKGVRYVDGGFSDNLPQLDDSTITVSPFCGEADICPKDNNAGLITVCLANTSIELSKENLYRFTRILFPPPPKVLSKMCQQGFNDALDFLQRNNLINCARCLAVQSTFSMCNGVAASDVPGNDLPLAVTCDEANCKDCSLQRQEAILDTLPEAVGSILQDAIDQANKGLMNWVFKHKSMKLLSILSLPYVIPVEIAYATFVKFLYTAPQAKDVKKLGQQLVQLVRALVRSWSQKLQTSGLPYQHTHHRHHDSNFSCQIAITEFTGEGDGLSLQNKQNFNIELDTVDHGGEAQKSYLAAENDSLNQYALRCAARSLSHHPSRAASRVTSRVPSRNPSRAVSRAVSRRPSEDDLSIFSAEWDQFPQTINNDNFEDILDVTSHQEALMAYYYLDDNNEMKVTEIFDLSQSGIDEHLLAANAAKMKSLNGEHLSEGEFRARIESFRESNAAKLSYAGSLSSQSMEADGGFSEPEADQIDS